MCTHLYMFWLPKASALGNLNRARRVKMGAKHKLTF